LGHDANFSYLILQVLSVLKRISDEDCQLLGLDPKYARPDWMILQVLPIPPPPVRPSVMMDTSSRSEASLFHFLFFFVNAGSFQIMADSRSYSLLLLFFFLFFFLPIQ
jgi:hypothetical protein